MKCFQMHLLKGLLYTVIYIYMCIYLHFLKHFSMLSSLVFFFFRLLTANWMLSLQFVKMMLIQKPFLSFRLWLTWPAHVLYFLFRLMTLSSTLCLFQLHFISSTNFHVSSVEGFCWWFYSASLCLQQTFQIIFFQILFSMTCLCISNQCGAMWILVNVCRWVLWLNHAQQAWGRVGWRSDSLLTRLLVVCFSLR